MAKYQGILKKSRTLDLAALTAMIGTAISLLPQVQALLEPEHYGITLVVLSLVQAWLRVKTTGPIGEKVSQETEAEGHH